MPHHLHTRTPLLFGLIVIAIGIFFGEYFGLYDHIPHFDKILHLTGGIIAGWLAFAFLHDDIRKAPRSRQALIVVGMACLIGVLWEFAEYAGNFTRHTYPLLYHYFHGGNLADTLGDLVADISGATLFAFWALYRDRT